MTIDNFYLEFKHPWLWKLDYTVTQSYFVEKGFIGQREQGEKELLRERDRERDREIDRLRKIYEW